MSGFNGYTTADEVVQRLGSLGANKVFLVTGATAGIGFETAASLASPAVNASQVILGCRSQEKGDACKAEILARHPEANVQLLPIDLSVYSSVRQAVQQLTASTIDVLICNAGLNLPQFRGAPEDGTEMTMQVCHFGHAYLCELLADRLRGGRLVMVSSESHRGPVEMDLQREDWVVTEDRYATWGQLAYGQAKLANILWADAFHRHHPEVEATSLHPGSFISTSIGRESTLTSIVFFLLRPFTKSVQQGAATSVYCALLDTRGEEQQQLALYYKDCNPAQPSSMARDRELADKLYELTLQRFAKL